MRNNFNFGVLVLTIGCLLQAGCGDKVAVAKQEIEKIQSTNSTQTIEPLPKIRSYPNNYYQPVVNTQLFYQASTNQVKNTTTDVNQSDKQRTTNLNKSKVESDISRKTNLVPKPMVKQEPTSVASSAVTKSGEALVAFNFNGFVFKGIVITPQAETLGLIELPNKQLITVKKGDYVGNNLGKVTEISQNFLQIEQSIWDGNKVKKIKQTLFLPVK
ncbi:pilus assembly protein PilP [Psychrobacter sp. HD31]|uniref:pilus assembly protein PilP n=1 Tax=Psychrobacter sp. HD31 TaxID=3112003 RepID=UPI003DA5875C